MNKNYLTLSLISILIVGCGSDTPSSSDPQMTEQTNKNFEQKIEQVVSNTPSCSDPEAIKIINKIFEQVVEEVGGKELVSDVNKFTSFDISKILINDINEKTGSSSCEATLEIIWPENFNKKEIEEKISLAATKEKYILTTLAASSINIADRLLSAQIKYTVRKTLDSGEIAVSLDGHQQIAFVTSAIVETGKFNENPIDTDKANDEALEAAETNLNLDMQPSESNSIEDCVDSHIEEFRKEHGDESIINYDVLEEWEASCKKTAEHF